MIFKPAHKQDNPALKPGQTVYGFDRYPYLKSSSAAEPPAKPRLTFDEWANQTVFTGATRKTEWLRSGTDINMLRRIWTIAQENK